MFAELFCTIPALQVIVCAFRESLRMPIKRDFPSKEQRNGYRQQTPGILFPNKEQRCKHHGIIPIVDPANAAALVLHKPCLKGAEE